MVAFAAISARFGVPATGTPVVTGTSVTNAAVIRMQA